MRSRYPPEIDATQLQHIIRSIYCGTLRSLRTIGGPSVDLCRALLALRDPGLGGRLSLDYVPILINLLKFWKVSIHFLRFNEKKAQQELRPTIYWQFVDFF